MQHEKKHIKSKSDHINDPLELFSGTYIDWGKTKEQIWAEIERNIEGEDVKTHILIRPWMKIAVAAAFALLLGVAAFMQFYTKTITVPAGQHSSILLPDGSQVQLNAQTTLSYKPMMWKFARNVNFEGEAFFEVNPGKKFQVISESGKTIVVGTSFNIYTRNNDYQVTCITGKVKVIETKGNKEVLILPGQKAAVNPEGNIDVHSDVSTSQSVSWLENKLSFTSVQLQKVFEEIERQYNVIITAEDLDFTYTGTFRRDTSAEKALQLVCKPFNLKLSQKSKNEYVITRNN
jgi:transmembrane sensor